MQVCDKLFHSALHKFCFLTRFYFKGVDDIDLYVGGLMEDAATGSIAGPTLNCLMGEHFSKLKYSDRFFYELGGQTNSFTSGIT